MTINELRIQYGLTQQQLADISGIPKRTVENWDEGSRNPPQYIVKLLAFFLEHRSE